MGREGRDSDKYNIMRDKRPITNNSKRLNTGGEIVDNTLKPASQDQGQLENYGGGVPGHIRTGFVEGASFFQNEDNVNYPKGKWVYFALCSFDTPNKLTLCYDKLDSNQIGYFAKFLNNEKLMLAGMNPTYASYFPTNKNQLFVLFDQTTAAQIGINLSDMPWQSTLANTDDNVPSMLRTILNPGLQVNSLVPKSAALEMCSESGEGIGGLLHHQGGYFSALPSHTIGIIPGMNKFAHGRGIIAHPKDCINPAHDAFPYVDQNGNSRTVKGAHIDINANFISSSSADGPLEFTVLNCPNPGVGGYYMKCWIMYGVAGSPTWSVVAESVTQPAIYWSTAGYMTAPTFPSGPSDPPPVPPNPPGNPPGDDDPPIDGDPPPPGDDGGGEPPVLPLPGADPWGKSPIPPVPPWSDNPTGWYEPPVEYPGTPPVDASIMPSTFNPEGAPTTSPQYNLPLNSAMPTVLDPTQQIRDYYPDAKYIPSTFNPNDNVQTISSGSIGQFAEFESAAASSPVPAIDNTDVSEGVMPAKMPETALPSVHIQAYSTQLNPDGANKSNVTYNPKGYGSNENSEPAKDFLDDIKNPRYENGMITCRNLPKNAGCQNKTRLEKRLKDQSIITKDLSNEKAMTGVFTGFCEENTDGTLKRHSIYGLGDKVALSGGGVCFHPPDCNRSDWNGTESTNADLVFVSKRSRVVFGTPNAVAYDAIISIVDSGGNDYLKLDVSNLSGIIIDGIPNSSAGLPTDAIWYDPAAGNVLKKV